MDPLPFIQLFAGKTKVTFIHALTGNVMGVQKLNPARLPESFTKPTNIEFNGGRWRVIRAEPIHAKDYILNNKLTLHIQEFDFTNEFDNEFLVPTLSDSTPILASYAYQSDFFLDITKEQWQQLEFLPADTLEPVKEEMLLIQPILNPGGNNTNLLGYKKIHLRKHNKVSLAIPLDEFYSQFTDYQKGSCRFEATGFIENGFAIRTENHCYYGLAEKGVINQLFLYDFDSIDEEVHAIILSYRLLLADWCNANIIYL